MAIQDESVKENRTQFLEAVENLKDEYSVYGLDWKNNRGLTHLLKQQYVYQKFYDVEAPDLQLVDGSRFTEHLETWPNGLALTRHYTMNEKVSDEDELPEVYAKDVPQPPMKIILFPESGFALIFLSYRLCTGHG